MDSPGVATAYSAVEIYGAYTVNENGGKFHLYWWSNISAGSGTGRGEE